MEADDAEARAWEVAHRWRPLLLSVLRRTGTWTIQEAEDVLEDFTSHRLAPALRTYQPERGALGPWLATVFRNHALRWRRRVDREADLFELLSEDVSRVEAAEQGGAESLDPASICAAFGELGEAQRGVLTAYFGSSQEGSNAALARSLGCSWHRARRLLFEALSEMVRRLADRKVTGASSSRGALLVLHDALSPEEAASYLGIEVAQLQEEVATLINAMARAIREYDQEP